MEDILIQTGKKDCNLGGRCGHWKYCISKCQTYKTNQLSTKTVRELKAVYHIIQFEVSTFMILYLQNMYACA